MRIHVARALLAVVVLVLSAAPASAHGVADGDKGYIQEVTGVHLVPFAYLAGVLTNDGQQISRTEALRLYTEVAAWFAFDERSAGSFDAGTHADLPVLSHDYLAVPDHMIRRIESVLTLLGGSVVHGAEPFAGLLASGSRV